MNEQELTELAKAIILGSSPESLQEMKEALNGGQRHMCRAWAEEVLDGALMAKVVKSNQVVMVRDLNPLVNSLLDKLTEQLAARA